MGFDKETIKKEVRELINQGHIAPEDIPSIELYMEQVTTFMDKYLSGYKRSEDDKTLTKTMINNYTKNDLLPPPEKKKYGKEHIVLLIYIYYLKQVMPISDIQTILAPLIEKYFGKERGECSLLEIYDSIYNLEKQQYENTENSIIKSIEIADGGFSDSDDEYLNKFAVLSMLAYDIFMKKKLMEHIVDELFAEQQAKKEAESKKKQSGKKDAETKKKQSGKTESKKK